VGTAGVGLDRAPAEGLGVDRAALEAADVLDDGQFRDAAKSLSHISLDTGARRILRRM
jgi:hypothetical protein